MEFTVKRELHDDTVNFSCLMTRTEFIHMPELVYTIVADRLADKFIEQYGDEIMRETRKRIDIDKLAKETEKYMTTPALVFEDSEGRIEGILKEAQAADDNL